MKITSELLKLEAAVRKCEECSIALERDHEFPVLNDWKAPLILGDPLSPNSSLLLVVGEALGREESLRGLPFVGPSGQLLDGALEHVSTQLLRKTCVVVIKTNVCLCRPLNNRTPHENEMLTCSKWLFREIELLQPDVILTLGKPAIRRLNKLEDDIKVGAWAGKKTWYRNTIPIINSYHPAFLLYRKGQTTNNRIPEELKSEYEEMLTSVFEETTEAAVRNNGKRIY